MVNIKEFTETELKFTETELKEAVEKFIEDTFVDSNFRCNTHPKNNLFVTDMYFKEDNYFMIGTFTYDKDDSTIIPISLTLNQSRKLAMKILNFIDNAEQ
jgi:hypothetical protein